MRPVAIAALLTACVLAAACGEKPQTVTARKADAASYTGSTGTHTAAGWKAGDAGSWETQIKTRAQSQNEYARIPAR